MSKKAVGNVIAVIGIVFLVVGGLQIFGYKILPFAVTIDNLFISYVPAGSASNPSAWSVGGIKYFSADGVITYKSDSISKDEVTSTLQTKMQILNKYVSTSCGSVTFKGYGVQYPLFVTLASWRISSFLNPIYWLGFIDFTIKSTQAFTVPQLTTGTVLEMQWDLPVYDELQIGVPSIFSTYAKIDDFDYVFKINDIILEDEGNYKIVGDETIYNLRSEILNGLGNKVQYVDISIYERVTNIFVKQFFLTASADKSVWTGQTMLSKLSYKINVRTITLGLAFMIHNIQVYITSPDALMTLALHGNADGTVKIDNAVVAYGDYDYPTGAAISLAAVPATNYRFLYWSIDSSKKMLSNPLSLKMDSSFDVMPVFEYSGTDSVTLTMVIYGYGTVSGYTNGTYTKQKNSVVTLTATAAKGNSFDKYIIDSVDVKENPHTLTLATNTNVKAYFAETISTSSIGYICLGLGAVMLIAGVAIMEKSSLSGGKW